MSTEGIEVHRLKSHVLSAIQSFVVRYGLGMALAKLGRDEDARTAYARARMLSQQQK